MTHTVTVTGTGVATAVPDLANIDLSATQRAGTAAQAFEGAATAAQLVVETAVRHVERRDVATRSVSLRPARDDYGRADGFEAEHRLEIRCPGLSEAGALLDALVAAAGERIRIHGVALGLVDHAAARRTAREAAWADARDRAGHLASLAGRELGEVVTVVEGAGAGPGDGRLLAMSMELEPGEQTVPASVTVTFALSD